MKDLAMTFSLEFGMLVLSQIIPRSRGKAHFEDSTCTSHVTGALKRSARIDLIDMKADILETLGKTVVRKEKKKNLSHTVYLNTK